jgi:hypothetical protein
MKRRSSLPMLLLALVCVGLMSAPGRSQTSRVVNENAALVRMLDEVVETKDFTNPMTLKDALQLFYEKYAARAKDLPIIVDLDSFKVGDPDGPHPYESQVQLPAIPKQMPMHVALRIVLHQVLPKATFIIRQGHIEIVHPSHAAAKSLLQRRVLTRFDKVPLRDALEDLAALTGAPIIFDVRVKEKGQEKVSILLNNMSLEDSLIALTEQAGLRFVTLESGIFVTSPEDAKNLEERQKKAVVPPAPKVEKSAPAVK